MSSSITTTLTVGVGLAVVPAVADGELGSVMGSMLLNVHVPTTHTTSPKQRVEKRAGQTGEIGVRGNGITRGNGKYSSKLSYTARRYWFTPRERARC